ncbi:hypothetical protein [Dysosmobacter sp.]
MKTYVKPELYYESFELSQHIAACDLKLESADPIVCSVAANDMLEGLGTILQDAFITSANCKFSYDRDYERYCYTNGTDTLPRFFQS